MIRLIAGVCVWLHVRAACVLKGKPVSCQVHSPNRISDATVIGRLADQPLVAVVSVVTNGNRQQMCTSLYAGAI